jgi:hypothetical protein
MEEEDWPPLLLLDSRTATATARNQIWCAPATTTGRALATATRGRRPAQSSASAGPLPLQPSLKRLPSPQWSTHQRTRTPHAKSIAHRRLGPSSTTPSPPLLPGGAGSLEERETPRRRGPWHSLICWQEVEERRG